MSLYVCQECRHRFFSETPSHAPEGCPECGSLLISRVPPPDHETVRVPRDPTPSENVKVANRARQLSEDLRLGKVDAVTMRKLRLLLEEAGR